MSPTSLDLRSEGSDMRGCREPHMYNLWSGGSRL